jgi:hypothetical protein
MLKRRGGIDQAPIEEHPAPVSRDCRSIGQSHRDGAPRKGSRIDPKGNLLTDLEPLIEMAPKGATLVVFHTAVLPYVASQQQRDRFAAMMRRGNAVWISNEGPGLFSFPTTIAPSAPKRGHFLKMVAGNPVAWTHPHGQSIDWFGTSY